LWPKKNLNKIVAVLLKVTNTDEIKKGNLVPGTKGTPRIKMEGGMSKREKEEKQEKKERGRRV
jgi:hypothetical protein